MPANWSSLREEQLSIEDRGQTAQRCHTHMRWTTFLLFRHFRLLPVGSDSSFTSAWPLPSLLVPVTLPCFLSIDFPAPLSSCLILSRPFLCPSLLVWGGVGMWHAEGLAAAQRCLRLRFLVYTFRR